MDDRFYTLTDGEGNEVLSFGKSTQLNSVIRAAKRQMIESGMKRAALEVRDYLGELLETINLRVKGTK